MSGDLEGLAGLQGSSSSTGLMLLGSTSAGGQAQGSRGIKS